MIKIHQALPYKSPKVYDTKKNVQAFFARPPRQIWAQIRGLTPRGWRTETTDGVLGSRSTGARAARPAK